MSSVWHLPPSCHYWSSSCSVPDTSSPPFPRFYWPRLPLRSLACFSSFSFVNIIVSLSADIPLGVLSFLPSGAHTYLFIGLLAASLRLSRVLWLSVSPRVRPGPVAAGADLLDLAELCLVVLGPWLLLHWLPPASTSSYCAPPPHVMTYLVELAFTSHSCMVFGKVLASDGGRQGHFLPLCVDM